ncbi:DUF1697 domain-containing protein [Fulvivirga sp. M361]|uniref:DUF1697 domain-containing protein n=1 Tax=Fulvivirga sp. M361 TaxID=2594266 RepID=UPI001179D6E2|nr:DUF1697 domain-containing protein [Fulvivirga sp. M361]TRX50021.1 DUF1697 domain-containing protein [Fulvivirga sp. M361]
MAYIALLRGINVSGQKIIKMAELKLNFEKWGFKKVKTYIQSGNIIFNATDNDPNQLAVMIAEKILDTYGFDVSVVVKSPSDLAKIIHENPFANDADKETHRVYFTLLAQPPSEGNIQKLSEYDFSPEQYILQGTVIYFYSPKAYGKAKMNNNFFENKLKVAATTRNFKTLNKLIDMTSE